MLRFPLSGALRPQLAADMRVIFHGNYGVYYLPREKDLIVIHVLHGARDVPAIAGQGGFDSA